MTSPPATPQSDQTRLQIRQKARRLRDNPTLISVELTRQPFTQSLPRDR